jgi:hypothetical protein
MARKKLKLKAGWTIKSARQLGSLFGQDIEKELAEAISDEVLKYLRTVRIKTYWDDEICKKPRRKNRKNSS